MTPRWLVLVACALVLGGARAGAIDRSAAPLSQRALDGAVVTLHGSLSQRTGDGVGAGPGPAARGALRAGGRDRAVVVTRGRYGPPEPALPRGARVKVAGTLAPLGRGPGDRRLARSGVAGRVIAQQVRWDGSRRGGVLGAIDRFAERAQQSYANALGERRGALVSGMALGLADGISGADGEALRASGLWHLVAASGGNIALVIALALAAGWLLGWPDRVRLGLAAICVAAYVPLAGAGPSIQRAGVMGLAALAALALGRERRPLDALALAAAATLALDPRAVLDVGWQLSFAAALALVVGAGPLMRHLQRQGVPRLIAGGLACTLLASAATAPVLLATFGEVSVVGVLSNLLVMPLVGVCVWSGALAGLVAGVSPAAAAVVAQPAGLAAGATLWIADWSAARSFAVTGATGFALILAGGALVWALRPPRAVVVALAVGALVFVAVQVPRAPDQPRVVVLDVGQGSATLLQDGDEGALIDAGPPDGGVVAAVRAAGVKRLRLVVLSHPAADHDGGAAAVLQAFPVGLVLDGGSPSGGATHRAAMQAAARRGVPVRAVRAGQRFRFGRMHLDVRWPTAQAARAGGDPNDRAAVIEVRAGALRALVPADAEGDVLGRLELEPADVLLVSHHGSDDPGLPALLHRIRPRAAVISVGARNTYGHPTRSTLGALQHAGVPSLRTDQDGSIDLRAGPGGAVNIRRNPVPGG